MSERKSLELRVSVDVVTHQGRNVGMLNAEDRARFNLCEAATLDDAVNLPDRL